jgi:hypothetical protein
MGGDWERHITYNIYIYIAQYLLEGEFDGYYIQDMEEIHFDEVGLTFIFVID